MQKILSHLSNLRQTHAGERISFVTGNFKVIHAGHMRLLRFAKEMSDILVVGVLPYNSYNAILSEEDRLSNIQALSMVDDAFLLSPPLQDVLLALRPNFVVKGKEHANLVNPESEIVDRYGGKLIFSSGASTWSETDITNGLKRDNSLRLSLPHAYTQRHGTSPQKMLSLLERMPSLRVLVVGDTIVDEYIHCDPLGMSQEDPTIVVSPTCSTKYLGGAGIVAAHAAGLGAQVHFATLCGQDATAQFVREKLHGYNVAAHIFEDDTRPTSLKQRFRCHGKTLLRVSHLRQHTLDAKLELQLLDELYPLFDDLDVLIFSDFNYGCLSQRVIDTLTSAAAKKDIFIAADSQSSSQFGDVSRFKNAHLLTPTEREARLAVHDFESGLVVLANSLIKKSSVQNVIMTLGEAGILIQHGAGDTTDQLPALNPHANDVAGAGDSLLVGTSLALALEDNIWQAAHFGSVAAAIQVSREGNIPLSLKDIKNCLAAN